MKRTAIIFFAFAVLLQACTKDNSHQKGVLSFSVAHENNIMVQTGTKATSALPNIDCSNFTVNAGTGNNEDTTSIVAASLFSSIEGKEFTVAQGSYVASAYNCTEEAAHPVNGFGQVRYYGKTSFSVTSGALTTVEIPCSVANSMVSVVLDNTFLTAFKADATTITISTNPERTNRVLEFTLANGHLLTTDNTEEANTANTAFYPAGTNLYITIKSQLHSLDGNGEIKSYTYKGNATSDGASITTAIGTWHRIKIGADLSNAPSGITIKVGQEQETIPNGISLNGYNNGSESIMEDK